MRYSSGISLQRARDIDRIDRRIGVIGNRRAGVRHRVVFVGDQSQHGLAAALAKDVVAGVDRDPVEPRGECGVAAELRELAQHGDERVLRRVARVVRVAQHAKGHIEDPRLMAFDEDGKRRFVSCEEPADELFVSSGSVTPDNATGRSDRWSRWRSPS